MYKLLNYTITDLSDDLPLRIEEAKAKAARVSMGLSTNDEEELCLSIIWFIARYYKIPIFSNYFKKRTLDDLLFESELITLETKPQETRTSDMLNNDKEGVKDLFADWEEDDFEEAKPNEKWLEEDKKFMTTGEFK